MKKTVKGLFLTFMLGVFALAMSGCTMLESVDNLYVLPALPEEYSQLQESIQSVMDELNAEYATINYGDNVSTVQMLDLDSDWEQETAAVFLRVTSTVEKPMRICLFRLGPNEEYELTYTIQGDGMSINSVVYEDLTGDGVCEILVSWQISAKVHILSAYQLTSAGAVELMNTTYNETYQVIDLDEDGIKEILTYQKSSTDAESNRAEYYYYQDGAIMMGAAAPLSNIINDVTSVRMGRLADGVRCVYVTGKFEGGAVTDILIQRDGGLKNVTINEETGYSQTTVRSYTDVAATDINGDGVIEIPLPYGLPSLNPETPSTHYALVWRQFDSKGEAANVSITYHSLSNGWYMTIPGAWLGKVTVAQDDSRSSRGERAVVFYYWPDRENTQPLPFMAVYRLTGDNRYSRARMPGRVTLYSDSSAIYCAAMNQENWNCGLNLEDLRARFNLITKEWSSQ